MGTRCEPIEKSRCEWGEIATVWVETATLILLAEFLAFSYCTDRLRFFLAPAYVWLPLAAAGALTAMGAARLWAHFRGRWLEAGALVLLVQFLVLSLFPNAMQAEFVAFAPLRDGIRVLLDPDYLRSSQAAALVLVVACAIRLRGRGRRAPSCACESSALRPASTLACMAALMAPMVLALTVNPTQLSPEGARKRRTSPPPRDPALARAVNWVLGLETAEKQAADGPVTLPKNPTVLDLLAAADEFQREALEGRFVTLVGQCDLPEGPNSQRFDLYRLVITCCIADATSVSVEIARPPNVKLDPGGWVRVGGIIKFDSAGGPSLPAVHAAAISNIPEPAKPYL